MIMKNANPHMINELSNLNSTKFQSLFPISSSIIMDAFIQKSSSFYSHF